MKSKGRGGRGCEGGMEKEGDREGMRGEKRRRYEEKSRKDGGRCEGRERKRGIKREYEKKRREGMRRKLRGRAERKRNRERGG